jgi:hypothetical protein
MRITHVFPPKSLGHFGRNLKDFCPLRHGNLSLEGQPNHAAGLRQDHDYMG